MNTLKLFSIFSLMFLACTPATKEGNSALEEERNSLRQEISSAKNELSALENQKATLTEAVVTKEKELSIYQEGRPPVYIVKFEVTLRKNLELLAYHSDFELPVSKEFFDAAEIGKNTSDLSGYKTLTIAIVWGDCKVVGKRIE